MAKVLIAYATRTGQTQNIADLIAEGIRFTGNEAKVTNATQIQKEPDLDGYDGYVFGSATYHGEMMPAMKQLLFIAAKAQLSGKVGGAFGAFGWSGEASDRIYETMKHILQLDMVGGSLRLKSSTIQGGMQMAQDYGRQIGKKVTDK
jgi:flavorubredoxin